MAENPGYQIIPADDARLISSMGEIVAVRSVFSKKRKDVEKGLDEIAEGAGQDSDDESALITPGTVEGLSLHNFKVCWFMNATGNFTSNQLKSKYGSLLQFWQLLFVAVLVTYLCFAFGALKVKDIKPIVVAEGKYPFTIIHDALWELKWLLAFVLGIFYYKSGHIERFLSGLRLPTDVYRKGRQHGFVYMITVCLTVIITPAFLHGMQLRDMGGKPETLLLCDALYTLFRIATVPSFCIVTVILYLIKVQIDSLGRVLKCINVNLGVPYAEREIREVKRVVRRADSKLKWYLLCHMILIILTAFTGAFSCIERISIDTTAAENGTSVTFAMKDVETDHSRAERISLKLLQLRREMNQSDRVPKNLMADDGGARHMKWLDTKTLKLSRVSKELLRLTLATLAETQRGSKPIRNVTLRVDGAQPSRMIVRLLEKTKPLRIFIEAVVALIEVVVLFLLPLMLLAWHERALLRITDEIVDLDVEDQRRRGFLIDSDDAKRKVAEYLRTMGGVTIFSMRVNFYKAAFVTMFAPFLTVTLHVVFKKYGFY